MSDASTLVNKLWSYCNVLRDDGLSYGVADRPAELHPRLASPAAARTASPLPVGRRHGHSRPGLGTWLEDIDFARGDWANGKPPAFTCYE